MRSAQQVEQTFLVVAALGCQRIVPGLQMLAKLLAIESLIQHLGVGQFIDRAWVGPQIPGRPASRAQKTQ